MSCSNPENSMGIILAAGTGSRLFPLTASVSKQLLPVYDKPLIYYPLSTLLLMGLKNIHLIVNSDQTYIFEKLLGDGSDFGININYHVQDAPKGLADAFNVVGEKNLVKKNVLILGDNIFYGSGMTGLLKDCLEKNSGATIFGLRSRNLQDFGVPFLNEGKVSKIVEKPVDPPSEFAIPGLYVYDDKVFAKTQILEPSSRGELEITDLNNVYIEEDTLNFVELPRGVAWFDSGTNETLHEANAFVSAVQKSQNILIGSPHEIAYSQGFISKERLNQIIEKFGKSDYGAGLKKIIETKNSQTTSP
tara:strand:+ start:33178 stop:34089 length:912 start_codon:yes stop_codon:yes gene_type:complete